MNNLSLLIHNAIRRLCILEVMKNKLKVAMSVTVNIFESKRTLVIILAIFGLQALWVAVSFRAPMIYDEGTHIGIIQAYSQQLSPYLEDPAATIPFHYSIYHYLMSFPYRLVSIFTNDIATHVITLRVINISMMSAGLVVFARLLRELGIRQGHINIGVLMYTLLPISSLVAATINYDNLLFLLTPLYFLLAVRIIQGKKVIWYDYAALVSIGAFATLVKYTFLPLMLVSVIYLGVVILRRFGFRRLFTDIFESFQKTALGLKVLILAGAVLALGIFSLEYGLNVIKYGSPQPTCFQVLDRDTCLANAIVQRGIQARATADQRPAVPLPDYTQIWITNMTKTTNWSGNSTTEGKVEFRGPLPVMHVVLFFGIILAVGVLLYSWRGIASNTAWYFLIAMVLVLFASVYLVNVKSYYANHAAFANQPRYLLTVLPILMVMVTSAVAYALGTRRWLKIGVLVVALVLLTQGGGIITHLLRSDTDWYWSNDAIIEVNEATKSIIAPLVIE